MTIRHQRSYARLYRVFTILASVLLLSAAAGGAYIWLLHAQASMENYRPPMRVQPQAPGQRTTPLAPQVVLVVIDGLRCDAVAGMPTLSLLQREGASARLLVPAPTYSQAAWTTLVTGAGPELNGAGLLNVPEEDMQPIVVDHIFAAAQRADLSTALSGSSWWGRMIPKEMLDAHFFADGFDAESDQLVADSGLRFLNNFYPNLSLIYFGNVDEVAHQAGATGHLYGEAALEVDDHLRDIVAAMDLRHSVLVVVSDHGQIERGGHGGGDRDVVYAPFVAVGDAVAPGDYGTINQTDVAPTIAAILGAPLPRLSQGVVRFEMLRTDLAKRAETQLDLALQRRDYANLYLRSIGLGGLSETAQGDVAVAVSSMEVGNLESAYRLASIAADRIDQEMVQARQQRIQRERSLRLPVALASIGVPLLFLAWRAGRRGLWLLGAAVVTLLVYHGLFLRQGQVYSFSGLTGLEPFLTETAQRMALASAVGALLVLWRLIRDQEASALEVIQTSLAYSLLLVYLLGCQAAVVYWLNGFRFSWYAPDMTVAFWHLSALVQALFAAGVGVVLPIVMILAGLAYQGALTLHRLARRPAGGS